MLYVLRKKSAIEKKIGRFINYLICWKEESHKSVFEFGAKNEALPLVLGGINRFRNFDDRFDAFRLTGVEGVYFFLNQKIFLYFLRVKRLGYS